MRRRFHALRLVIFALLAHWLAACQLLSRPPDIPVEARTWPDHVAHLEQLSHWRIRGKIGVVSPEDSGSAWIDWTQRGDAFHIYLSGPLGQGATHIRGDHRHATLETSEGRWSAETPDALVQAHTHLKVPVGKLLYWVRGIPAPDEPPEMTLNAQGTLQTLRQDQWRLDYPAYLTALDNRLPAKLRMTGDRVRVTLVIKSWELPASP